MSKETVAIDKETAKAWKEELRMAHGLFGDLLQSEWLDAEDEEHLKGCIQERMDAIELVLTD